MKLKGPYETELIVHVTDGEVAGKITVSLSMGEPPTQDEITKCLTRAKTIAEENRLRLMTKPEFFNVMMHERFGANEQFACPNNREWDTDEPPSSVLPKINIRCECHDGVVHGSTNLNVIRVEEEDDGSFTAVTDHWPSPTTEKQSAKPSPSGMSEIKSWSRLRDELEAEIQVTLKDMAHPTNREDVMLCMFLAYRDTVRCNGWPDRQNADTVPRDRGCEMAIKDMTACQHFLASNQLDSLRPNNA